MTPHITIDVPRYDGRDDHRLGTLTCHAPWPVSDGVEYLRPAYFCADDIVDMVYPIYTRASYDDATAHDNPTADPTRPYGHLPRGVFKVGQPAWADEDGKVGASPEWRKKFGPVFIPLLPACDNDMAYLSLIQSVDSQWDAWNAFHAIGRQSDWVRSGLGLHGGPLDSKGRLRCTYGCGRGYDDDVVQQAKWVERVLPTVDELFAIVRGMV